MLNNEITEKQEAIFNYIKDNLEVVIPTYRAIGDHFGITVRCVSDYLRVLEKKGFLERISNKTRNCYKVLK